MHRYNHCFIIETEIVRENQSHCCNLCVTIATAITTQIDAQIFYSMMKTWSSRKVLSPRMSISAQ